ncbi:terminase large subunit [Pelosinus sp. Bkl1]|uniref:Terminase large subunit n=2 Tax=Pelosinus baikalensis TaxID=2892015 RepID=A0ABS8HSG4_9FIRM|nr:terminase large subunit [Pelosinus baikalensis]
MDAITTRKVIASKDILLAMIYVKEKLNNPDVVIKADMIEKAVELTERYFETKLVDWELFIIALIHCYYKSTDMVVFSEFLIVMGRGNGKNGFISLLAWYLTTHYHGVREYNIDIVANSEKQAMTSFEDVYNVLERTWAKSKKFFYKSKEKIINLKTKSYIRYNTSNADTKDGGRPGCLIFDEIHGYETDDTIRVFTSGFGKKKHSRTFYITTNGYVRGGVLDAQLEMAEKILQGKIKNLRLLPLIYRIDKKEEAQNPDMWHKANPSLAYFPILKSEMDDDFIKMQYQPTIAIEFMTKRMNHPAQDNFLVVTPWEKILATNKPIPYDELQGLQCIGWIDYARITDFASVGLMFKHKGKRICIEHSFVCRRSLQIESRPIKFPIQEAVDKGLITIVENGPDGQIKPITPQMLADWFLEQAKKYHIKNIACDSYRKSILEEKFTEVGLPLTEVRSGPITHAKLSSLIELMFTEENLILGDNITMRWYINNTCQEMDKKGNVTYLKIEPKTRKTDGFFGLIHALSLDSELVEVQGDIITYDVYTY